jgi:germination protein M
VVSLAALVFAAGAAAFLLPGCRGGDGGGEAGESAAGGTEIAGEEGVEAPGAGEAATGAAQGAVASGEAAAEGAAEGAAGGPAGEAAPEQAPSFTSDQNRREVTLFFQEKDSEYLAPERRKIFLTASPADQAKQIIGELIQGPRGADLLPTIPKDTMLRGLYLDKSGTAYVDLSGEFAARHPGGTSEEIATLFSLVNSLTYNLPEIKRVHLMIDGEERDAFVHLDLLRDYRQDLSIVDMERGKAG